MKREIADTKSVVSDYGARLDTIESTLESVVAGYEQKFADISRKATAAREQRRKDLIAVRKDIELFIQIVELSAEAQLDKVRAVRVAKLLKTARSRRTRLDNLLAAKVANDAA